MTPFTTTGAFQYAGASAWVAAKKACEAACTRSDGTPDPAAFLCSSGEIARSLQLALLPSDVVAWTSGSDGSFVPRADLGTNSYTYASDCSGWTYGGADFTDTNGVDYNLSGAVVRCESGACFTDSYFCNSELPIACCK